MLFTADSSDNRIVYTKSVWEIHTSPCSGCLLFRRLNKLKPFFEDIERICNFSAVRNTQKHSFLIPKESLKIFTNEIFISINPAYILPKWICCKPIAILREVVSMFFYSEWNLDLLLEMKRCSNRWRSGLNMHFEIVALIAQKEINTLPFCWTISKYSYTLKIFINRRSLVILSSRSQNLSPLLLLSQQERMIQNRQYKRRKYMSRKIVVSILKNRNPKTKNTTFASNSK